MDHSQTMSDVCPTPAAPCASQMMATEQSQEEKSMQQEDADQRRHGQQQDDSELNQSTGVNEILLKLLVTSMYAATLAPCKMFSLPNHDACYWIPLCKLLNLFGAGIASPRVHRSRAIILHATTLLEMHVLHYKKLKESTADIMS